MSSKYRTPRRKSYGRAACTIVRLLLTVTFRGRALPRGRPRLQMVLSTRCRSSRIHSVLDTLYSTLMHGRLPQRGRRLVSSCPLSRNGSSNSSRVASRAHLYFILHTLYNSSRVASRAHLYFILYTLYNSSRVASRAHLYKVLYTDTE